MPLCCGGGCYLIPELCRAQPADLRGGQARQLGGAEGGDGVCTQAGHGAGRKCREARGRQPRHHRAGDGRKLGAVQLAELRQAEA